MQTEIFFNCNYMNEFYEKIIIIIFVYLENNQQFKKLNYFFFFPEVK